MMKTTIRSPSIDIGLYSMLGWLVLRNGSGILLLWIKLHVSCIVDLILQNQTCYIISIVYLWNSMDISIKSISFISFIKCFLLLDTWGNWIGFFVCKGIKKNSLVCEIWEQFCYFTPKIFVLLQFPRVITWVTEIGRQGWRVRVVRHLGCQGWGGCVQCVTIIVTKIRDSWTLGDTSFCWQTSDHFSVIFSLSFNFWQSTSILLCEDL